MPEGSNPRNFPREAQGTLNAALVNPADKYQSKADNLHKYGSWLMGCLPKYIQQFSVWKDELTIYIPPSGVIPVFSFLKCKNVFGSCFDAKNVLSLMDAVVVSCDKWWWIAFDNGENSD